MNKHRFINNPEDLLKEGKRIVSENADNKFVFQVTMVNLLLSGVNAVELSKLSGESPRTLQTWLKSVDENGWDSLQAVKQTGRPSKLSDDQIETLKAVVSDDPNVYGYSNWDGPTLSDYIGKTFSIKYGVRACQKLLHKMGFALVRPHTFPSLGIEDSQIRAEFKKN